MFWWLTQHLATTALLFVVVWLVCRLAKPRPAARNLLWLVVLIKLLTPPLFNWSLPDIDVGAYFAAAREEKPAAEPAPSYVFPALYPPNFVEPPSKRDLPVPKEAIAKDAHSKQPEPVETDSALLAIAETGSAAAVATAVPATRAEILPPAAAVPPFPWAMFVGLAWITLALGMLVVQIIRVVRFHRQALRSEPAPRWLVRMVRELAAKLEVAAPRVRLVTGLGTPAIWSLGQPELLWPVELVDRFDADKCRGIVAHELAHLRRRDHWVARLLLLADCVWWWNPLFWLIRRELRHSAEWACDAWVVWALPEQRRAYAETLIEVSRVVSNAALPAPALGIGGAHQAFQRRLTMIMCEHVPCRVSRWALVAIGLAALAIMPGWARAQTREIQDTVNAQLDAVRLKQSLTALEAQKKKLEGEIEVLRKHIDALKEQSTAIDGAEGRIKELQAVVADYRDKLVVVQQERERVLKPKATSTDRVINQLFVSDLEHVTGLDRETGKRAWGPEQATGAPDCGDAAADNQKAWASKTEDEQDEWLHLAYDKPVRPVAILIYENYNPGALYKVSVFTPNEPMNPTLYLESEVWKGKDPTAPGSGRGVSVIPVKLDHPITAVRLFLHSPQVKGWNEIDAVGLLDSEGKIQWAARAEASSTYAEQSTAAEGLSRLISRRTGTGGLYTTTRSQSDDQRLDRLEKDVKDLKDMIQKLVGKSDAPAILPPAPVRTRAETDLEIQRLLKENQDVQQRLKDLESRQRKP